MSDILLVLLFMTGFILMSRRKRIAVTDQTAGIRSFLKPEGPGASQVAQFMAADPLFKERLRAAELRRLTQIGRPGKMYPYREGNMIHDIGFPYIGAPLSYVTYPVGSTPAHGTWEPIDVRS